MKKIIFSLIVCLFAAGSIINMHLAENNHNMMEVSLADISAMAQADGESSSCPGWDGVTPYCQWDEIEKDCVRQAECNQSCPESVCG